MSGDGVWGIDLAKGKDQAVMRAPDGSYWVPSADYSQMLEYAASLEEQLEKEKKAHASTRKLAADRAFRLWKVLDERERLRLGLAALTDTLEQFLKALK